MHRGSGLSASPTPIDGVYRMKTRFGDSPDDHASREVAQDGARRAAGRLRHAHNITGPPGVGSGDRQIGYEPSPAARRTVDPQPATERLDPVS